MPQHRDSVLEFSRTLFASGALLITLGCSSPRRDLGQTAQDEPDAMRSSECESAGETDKLQAPPAALLSDFAGVWIGRAEDALGGSSAGGALPIYAFPSGSTRILLEVSQAEPIVATLTLGAAEPRPGGDRDLGDAAGTAPLPPREGHAYRAEPVASALDLKRAGDAEGTPFALDGKLVLAFSTDDRFVSELHLRFAGEGLIGAFDGLSLINERGYLTRPGSVRFRRVTRAPD